MNAQDEFAAQFRADMARARRRRNRGHTKITVTFWLTDETRRRITERMWPADEVPLTRQGMATVEAIQDWLAERVLGTVDDEARISECVELDCLDTDDDHDHADGPKR